MKVNSQNPRSAGPGQAGASGPDPRRDLPSVDRLARALDGRLPEWARTAAARAAVDAARERLAAGAAAGDVEADAATRAGQLARPSPQRVVNATGVVLHTNLGRSAMAPGAAHAAAEAAAAYCDLELDLASGARGDRMARVAMRLRLLSGAPAALVVNNAAAAVLLAVQSLAAGKEVVVSRGELVEIGGSFRVPAILEAAGVRLVEVGTTNRTHPDDYRSAIGPDTGLLLKVHRSNFELRGFVKEVGLAELVAIGRERSVPVVEDLGSGSLVDLGPIGLPPESFAPARLATGVDLVCFSGDKLLGGPQAGIALGSREVVSRMKRSPLARALRPGKLSLAALDWTLGALLEGRSEEIPTLRQLAEPEAAVARRARALADRLGKALEAASGGSFEISVEAARAPVGGGSIPGFELASHAVTLRARTGGPDALAAALRAAPVPVIARVRDDCVMLDARTLLPGDDADVEAAVVLAASLSGEH